MDYPSVARGNGHNCAPSVRAVSGASTQRRQRCAGHKWFGQALKAFEAPCMNRQSAGRRCPSLQPKPERQPMTAVRRDGTFAQSRANDSMAHVTGPTFRSRPRYCARYSCLSAFGCLSPSSCTFRANSMTYRAISNKIVARAYILISVRKATT